MGIAATQQLGLEVCLTWGDQRVGAHLLPPGASGPFRVGNAPGVDFAMGTRTLGAPSFDLVQAHGGGFALRFTDRMQGALTRGGQTVDLRDALEAGQAQPDGEAYALPLEAEDTARVDLGGVTAQLAFQPLPRRAAASLDDVVDFTWVNVLLGTCALAALLLVTALNQEEGAPPSDELTPSQARFARSVFQAAPPPPAPRRNDARESGEKAARHSGPEGQAGRRNAPSRSAQAAPRGDPSQKNQARALAQALFGGPNGRGIRSLLGPGGVGGELQEAMGHLVGVAPGDARGFNGLGIRGDLSGGGGDAVTVGIGAIGTKGRGNGRDPYGDGVGKLTPKASPGPELEPEPPTILGSLDRELIRQVVHLNRAQIRFCYESQLTRSPKLNGKVAVKFIISANGSVASSTVAQATTQNAALETCVAGRVHGWQFPKPKGGGVVIVTYPFLFRPSGE